MEQFLMTEGTQISFLIRLISLIICLLFVLPLMVKNSIIKNGLRQFRVIFLLIGLVGIVVNIQTMIFLFDLLINQIPQRVQNASLQLTNAIYEFIRTGLFYSLYRLSFTEDNIKLHQDIEKKELKKGGK